LAAAAATAGGACRRVSVQERRRSVSCFQRVQPKLALPAAAAAATTSRRHAASRARRRARSPPAHVARLRFVHGQAEGRSGCGRWQPPASALTPRAGLGKAAAPPADAQPPPSQAGLPADAASFSLEAYADQLKQARRLSSFSSLLPKGAMQAAGGDASVAEALKRQEDVIRCARQPPAPEPSHTR